FIFEGASGMWTRSEFNYSIKYTMYTILYIYICMYLAFDLVHGYQCYETYKECLVDKTESQDESSEDILHGKCSIYKINSNYECQRFVEIGDGEKNFVFYIKPLKTNTQLSISLHKIREEGRTTEITCNLFTIPVLDANKWYKINVSRSEATGAHPKFLYSYFLEINNQRIQTNNQIVVRRKLTNPNQIRVETITTSFWSYDCDPRQHQTSSQPAPEPDPQGSRPSLLPTWMLPTIAAASLLLVLVIIIIVILVVRHKKRNSDPALAQSSENKSRLSRHVSENSLYESYDNRSTGENKVPRVTMPADGTRQDVTFTNQSYGEVDPQGNSATTSPATTANQRRGSEHDSENSLYGGFN
ncbi:unnamed protein product, partial [Meganyctiphanes norvegica]